jgi:hypothetical protein
MHITDIHIGNTIDGLLTVEFRGEGGELVSVRMASDSSVDGDAAVLHAKAILVQVAAFDNDHDNNFDTESDEAETALSSDAVDENEENEEAVTGDPSSGTSNLPQTSSFS